MALWAISSQTQGTSVVPPSNQSEIIAGIKTNIIAEQSTRTSAAWLQGTTNSNSSAVTKILEAQWIGKNINTVV